MLYWGGLCGWMLNWTIVCHSFSEKAWGERAWLPLEFACSTSYTFSGRRKGPFSRPRDGEGEPFSHWACGKLLLHTVHAICIWPILFPKVPVREESVERSQNSSNPSLMWPSGPLERLAWTRSVWHFCLGNVAFGCVTLARLNVNSNASPWHFCAMYVLSVLAHSADLNVRVNWRLNLAQQAGVSPNPQHGPWCAWQPPRLPNCWWRSRMHDGSRYPSKDKNILELLT